MTEEDMPTDSSLRATRRVQLDDRLLGQLQAIYFASFPPSQREEFQTIVSGIADGTCWLFTVVVGGELLSFATVVPLEDTDVHYLEYIATGESGRGLGIGGKLLQFICAHLRTLGTVSGLLFEVETEDAGSDAERPIRRRRIEFYQRHGAHVVQGAPAYRAPNFAGEGTIPYRLMWIPIRSEVQTLAGPSLGQAVVSIFRQCYERSADDPLLRSVLEDLTS
jgi:GNAT superfamily N-acetyltransferase